MSEETQLFGQGKPGQMQYEMHLTEARNKIIDAMRVIGEARYFVDGDIRSDKQFHEMLEWVRRQSALNCALMLIDTAQTMKIPTL
ncbi:MAG: hypothetical protein SPK50_03005 [Mobiluncus porci]|uniref:hypothetical protein n=1 Tax=Mobiluncus porci TaxID=2652278 RepID=UPI0023F58772|nr:hypothetical protein [Mobiluncus porci]MDD7541197.1 hypothetical protein [Mobiluncus porci]MDY5748086.1 hypothetical protein [Mobiluncus porci]